MDRPIDEKEIQKRRYKQIVIAVAIVVGVVLLFVLFRNLITPGVRSSRIRTAVVERGPVESVINASGHVVPEFEQVLACPFDTRVLRVVEEPGAGLETGQAILLLDDRDVRAEIAQYNDEISLLRNQRQQLEIDLAQQLEDLSGQMEILELRIEYLAAKTEQQRQLNSISASTPWDVRQAELNENISRIELRQLEEQIENTHISVENEMEGLDIEIRLLQQQLNLANEKLEKATVRTAVNGVLTWVVSEEGAAIREGEVLARVADLTRFRVEATVSDLHASRLSVGLPVTVEVNNERLSGAVASIPPNIDQGVMTLVVSLDSSSHPQLRSNLRVDVFVITEQKDNVLRIAKGPFANGPGRQDVFVVRGNRAEKVRAVLGIAGVDYFEIEEGIEEGETVIISNMNDYVHLPSLRIR